MNKYRVFVEQVVSYYLDVEAEDREAAVEESYRKDLLGLMFLDHQYPDEAGWEVCSDEGGPVVELLEGEEP